MALKRLTIILLAFTGFLLCGCDNKNVSEGNANQTSGSTKEIKSAESDNPNKDYNHAGTSYTIETFGGVPRITSDGYPVRGRMFYGGFPGAKHAIVKDKKTDISFELTPDKDDANAFTRYKALLT